MILIILSMQPLPMEMLFPIILMGALAVGDILLLKLGLVITKAQKRKRMKWVAGSFLIQFGIVFAISSPLFLLGATGAFNREPIGVIIGVMMLSAFIDFNIINILHQIGLKRSLIIVVLVFVPIFFIMYFLGGMLSQMP
jgi:hypothetical protein